jgi:hypothetical protein
VFDWEEGIRDMRIAQRRSAGALRVVCTNVRVPGPTSSWWSGHFVNMNKKTFKNSAKRLPGL